MLKLHLLKYKLEQTAVLLLDRPNILIKLSTVMKWIKLALLSLLSASSLFAEAPTQEALSKELTTVFKAPYENNTAFILKHTHPNVLRLVGGEENFKKQLVQLGQIFKKSGVAFKSVEIGKPEGYAISDTHECFYTKAKLTLTKNGEEIISDTLQFAIKPKDGATWYYIDLGNKDRETLKLIAPGLPEAFKFPVANAEEEKK